MNQTLYRGIVISDDQIKTAPYFNTTLTPFHPAKMDAQGRKTIGDGNEYGIYMSDNLTMVECSYGKVRKYHGRALSPAMRISINGAPAPVTYPSIGVIYTVNANGLQVREPWLCKSMSGHYNNGFEGKEWVVDAIPASNYTINKMVLSADWLHPEQTFIVSDLMETQDTIERIIHHRKLRLQRLQAALETVPEHKRLNLSANDARVLFHLFKQDGASYTLPECYHPSTAYEYAMFLMTYFYRKNRTNLDWSNLGYISNLISKLPTSAPMSTLVQLINNDISANFRARSNFIQKKLAAGEPITTTGFDAKHARYELILQLLLDKYHEND